MLGAFEVISPWSDVNEMKRTIRGGRMVTVVDDAKQAIVMVRTCMRRVREVVPSKFLGLLKYTLIANQDRVQRKGIGDERRSVRGRRREDGAQGVERGGGELGRT